MNQYDTENLEMNDFENPNQNILNMNSIYVKLNDILEKHKNHNDDIDSHCNSLKCYSFGKILLTLMTLFVSISSFIKSLINNPNINKYIDISCIICGIIISIVSIIILSCKITCIKYLKKCC